MPNPRNLRGGRLTHILITIFAFLSFCGPEAFSASIYDQPKALSAKTFRAIQTLLLEHERLTGDEISLAVISQRANAAAKTETNGGTAIPTGTKEWAHATYLGWRMGSKNAGRGILLVLSPESKEAEIEVGYGLESVVTPEVFTSLRDDSILPSLAERKLNAAAIQGVYAILEALSSPLVQSGEASETLQKDGIDDTIFEESSVTTPPAWLVVVIVSTGCLLILFMVIRSQKKQFGKQGWFKRGWLGKPTTAAEFLQQLDALPGDRLGDLALKQSSERAPDDLADHSHSGSAGSGSGATEKTGTEKISLDAGEGSGSGGGDQE